MDKVESKRAWAFRIRDRDGSVLVCVVCVLGATVVQVQVCPLKWADTSMSVVQNAVNNLLPGWRAGE